MSVVLSARESSRETPSKKFPDAPNRHFAYPKRKPHRKDLDQFLSMRHFPVLRYRKKEELLPGVIITPKQPRRPYTHRSTTLHSDVVFEGENTTSAYSTMLKQRSALISNDQLLARAAAGRSHTAPTGGFRPPFRPTGITCVELSQKHAGSVFTNTPYENERNIKRAKARRDRSLQIEGAFRPPSRYHAREALTADYYMYSADEATKMAEREILRRKAHENLHTFTRHLDEMRPKHTPGAAFSRSFFPSKYDQY